jgi:hypothetical protein
MEGSKWHKTQLVIETDSYGEQVARLYFVDECLCQSDWTEVLSVDLALADGWESTFLARLCYLHNKALEEGK